MIRNFNKKYFNLFCSAIPYAAMLSYAMRCHATLAARHAASGFETANLKPAEP